MKCKVIELSGKASKHVELPEVFSSQLRPDLVKRAYWIVNSHSIQPYGRDPMAGERTSARSWQTGRGVARVPRVKGERHPRSGQAAGVASVVKGRLPHPPKAEKVIYRKINEKERKLALASAIAFTADAESVGSRGHRLSKTEPPVVVTDDVESISKTAEVKTFLAKAGLEEELARLYDGVKRLSGKSRMRGRAHRERIGPLFVVTNDRGLGRAATSIPGVDVVPLDSLSVVHLSPGAVPGRLTLWTESSLELLRAREKEVEMKVAA